ncbi:P-II family nitrogen regulator [Methylophilus medardicus]|uniref:P-II family nitrogen regulator n=1 Tax=Methylophilus medardicus TaxID=2588534 RepID=A0A5B8CQK1_9PROT|nr:P-II family nitrogen regulator [Methylophilus medardicus]QDC43487.1 P-II family nitrogen regulator [Methylophilus medardicus]QDC48494.1 P-II family nitrogen regulator [Methylophilus medardicus]QDC52199.1 P-II family nitrogen regulator [Methylophilus medardicus]
MKEIKAVIQPARLAKIRSALRNIKGFPGMSVSKMEGCGPHLQKPSVGVREELTDYSPKVYIYMVVPDDLVEGVLQTIVEVGHTGNIGDGIVWVTPVERMIRLSEQIMVLD